MLNVEKDFGFLVKGPQPNGALFFWYKAVYAWLMNVEEARAERRKVDPVYLQSEWAGLLTAFDVVSQELDKALRTVSTERENLRKYKDMIRARFDRHGLGTSYAPSPPDDQLTAIRRLRRFVRETADETTCRCHEAYTDRGRHEPNSFCYLAEEANELLADTAIYGEE